MNITYPWYMGSYFKSYNPYLSIELNRTLRSKNSISIIHPIEAGIFLHKYIENTIFIQSGIGMELKKKYFFLAMDFTGGYAHWFNKREVFEIKDGTYQKKRNSGNPALILGPGIKIGFFTIKDKITPLISYQWLFQAPFIDEIPLITHTTLALNVKVKIGNRHD